MTHSRNVSDLAQFKIMVLFLHKNPSVVGIKFNPDLNGMDYYTFRKTVNGKRKEYNAAHPCVFNGERRYDYTIVPIMNEKQAKEYGDYTSWCVTNGSYYSYAQYGSRFYFCLCKGFENVPCREGENCPLDEYGLSMISVLIDMEGNPTLITTRWNHDHDGENNPALCTKEQVQEVVGVPFDETFKPYTREELMAMGITPFDEVQERLDNGEDPREIFEEVNDFINGSARVKLNGKWNLINTDGQIIFDRWFDFVSSFSEGCSRVQLNGKWNFIGTDGKLISEQWFDWADPYNEGFAVIKINCKWNYINTDGEIAFPDQWFDFSGSFSEGLAKVKLNGEGYKIDRSGNLYN